MSQRAPLLFLLFLAAALALGLSACRSSSRAAPLDTEGLTRLFYRDIDTICEDPALSQAGGTLLETMAAQEGLLLSFAVDTSIALDGILGDYDHLALVDPAWMERYDSLDHLNPLSLEDLSPELQDFLLAQLPLWTVSGEVLPEGLQLCSYTGEGLPLLGARAGEEIPLLLAQRPLVLLVEEPARSLRPECCTLPLSSSGNLLFVSGAALESALEGSPLLPYLSACRAPVVGNDP